MPRKPVDIAHVNLRIRENLRKKLADEARKHRFSLNNEIRIRLEESFEREGFQSIAKIAAQLAETQKVFQSLAETSANLTDPPNAREGLKHAALLVGRLTHDELLRDTDALLTAIEQDEPDAIKNAAAKLEQTRLKATVFPLQKTRIKP
jgi:hypothetical protein